MEQTVIFAHQNYSALDEFFAQNKIKSIFLVKSASFERFPICKYFSELKNRLGIEVVFFNDFHPNPDYESVVKGEQLFQQTKCDCIIAIGGGSTIDVAKCIKLYAALNPAENFLQQKPIPNSIKLIAAPTTAGTGSEATRYAVIYYNGEKQSITNETFIPSQVIFDASFLTTLPEYQRKSTMLDALCHSIESFWSVNSNTESKGFSEKAIKMILENMDSYLRNEEHGNYNMLLAANIAGKAINITQTTAGHAMCYKLTSLYGIAHGHAASLCVSALFDFMPCHTDLCIDARGKEYLEDMFNSLARIMDCKNAIEASKKFKHILERLALGVPSVKEISDFEVLRKSVNPERLKNNPVRLSEENIEMLYHQILEEKE